ncbi:hepatocyte growth factor-regulated tyrosine kinase substrate-like isoform X2 [Penaeus japonicus]|uniref:hepatocyte growth factor-regulated tyrosine kinase substrate-like isoform X2 n=1 Tax=Penaeus japonicus TaxID=27405 RepID=UPI001C7131D0|nr:hepatocyte growth factor-regulated tyrosine kinase substrate-like isoform X2 [Penaeus japonicus]
MSSEINLLLEKATSPLLLDIDWDSTLHIVDLIRQGDVNPKAAVQSLLNRLKDTNPNVVLLALQVFESVVKNCGQSVHEQVACRGVMEQVSDILRTNPNEEVRKKILMMLATWVYAFRNEPKYRAVQDTVNILRTEGFHLPTVSESDAMFTADRAPDWADGECCHRCRSQFTIIRRKHHCRACGQVFCGDCSSKFSTIPKFGIEREVRVCESCYDDINKSSVLDPVPWGQETRPAESPQRPPTSTSKVETEEASSPKAAKTPGKKSEEELKEEEELQLALALSKSEAENKEKEKLRATSNLLGGNWRQSSPTPAQPSVQPSQDKEDMDPELARYLNRPYWEQQSQQKQTFQPKQDQVGSDLASTLSPTQPSAPINATKSSLSPTKLSQNYQNGETEEVDEFVSTLRTQLEIFVNRMKSNQCRGRPIANDSSVQTLFMNITAMHAQLLKYIHQQDDKRVNCERLQDKISQVRDARAALEALREEHRERVRREKEEQERLRQVQMMQKLEIMRKKKQEYLEYQRQLALHRMAESEREMFNKGAVMGPPSSMYPMGYPTYPGVPGPMPNQPPLPGHMYQGQPESGPPQGGVPQGGMPQTGVPPGGVPQGGPPPNSMSYPGGPGQGQYQHPPPGSHPGPAMPGGQAGPPPVTQPGYQPPPHEFSPFNMQGMANTLPNISGGMPGYPPQQQPGPGMAPPQIASQHPMPGPGQQPQGVMPMQGDMSGGAPQIPPQTQPPPTTQEQQAELISFD